MRILVGSACFLTLLAGCASMPAPRPLDTAGLAAVRNQGIGNLERVAAVVLETDGSFSVIAEVDEARASALADVVGFHG